MKKLLVTMFAGLLLATCFNTVCAQSKVQDLSKINDPEVWSLHNREILDDEVVHLNGQPGDGLLWINDLNFKNGTIDVDIKGIDERGRSFVGIAFHILNDSTFDAIYFRPFNFMSPERNGHSVQYISHPRNTWYYLRENFPEKYENPVNPVPDPTGWFHATIVVDYPKVSVYVDKAEEPSLVIEQISDRKEGQLGFWVGNNSEGWFRNLKITAK
ncbi:MAG: DUF1080 domain-containing protein [Cyclobacteriaceae bacterium]|jgi:hypothetical protein